MSRPATPINLTADERAELERLARLPKAQRRHSDRARIILKVSNLQIAKAIETRPATVSKWRVRFEKRGHNRPLPWAASKRRDEFLCFLDTLVAQHPGKELHLVIDNLSVHKLKEDHPWRLKNPNVHFHFTPTHASWVNQIEAWFSILSRSALKQASFRNAKELIAAIEEFTQAYNKNAEPFQWTKIRVTQKNTRK